MKSIFYSGLKLAIATNLFSLVPMNTALADFNPQDKCVQAAIADTNTEFPIGKTVTSSFYEWLSGHQAVWQEFDDLVNLGAQRFSYVSEPHVAGKIIRNHASYSELTLKKNLLNQIAGKKLFYVFFRFQDASLLRYYTIESNSLGSCEVKHIDTKIDDFDNA